MERPLALLIALGCSLTANAQVATAPYAEHRSTLQQRGTHALQAESARVAAQPCTQPENTAGTSACLRAQAAEAEANYKAYTASIDGLLQLLPPDATRPERDDSLEIRKNFRLAESRWLRYRDAQCEAVQLMSCEPDLTHRHMEELGSMYDRLFH